MASISPQSTTDTPLIPDPRAHFSFTALPFTQEIPANKMWRQPGLDELVDDLEAAVSARMSVAVIAASGTGKTTLMRRLVERLPDTRYQVADIKVTSVSHRDFYRGLARALAVEPTGTWPALLEKLQEHAQSLAATEARRLVVIVDEAQDMRPEVLSTLRVLTNFNLLCAAAHKRFYAEHAVMRSSRRPTGFRQCFEVVDSTQRPRITSNLRVSGLHRKRNGGQADDHGLLRTPSCDRPASVGLHWGTH